jgi:tetratricopeptide (TPR) repeat protein
MSTAESLQTLRRSIRALWQAEKLRSKQEAEAEARRKEDLLGADQIAHAARETASGLLEAAYTGREEGRAVLGKAGLAQLLDGGTPVAPGARYGEDPKAELEMATNSARNLGNLRDAVGLLLGHRAAAAEAARRRAAVRFAVVVVGIVSCPILIGAYAIAFRNATLSKAEATRQALAARQLAGTATQIAFATAQSATQSGLQIERYYLAAQAYLEQGQWEQARIDLQSVLEMDATYRDTQTLLRETYYLEALQAIQNQDWGRARESFERIRGYRDVETLISELLPATFVPGDLSETTSELMLVEIIVEAAREEWLSTSIRIEVGNSFRIEAAGLWSHGYDCCGPNPYDANGYDDKLDPSATLPGERVGALIGKIGDCSPFLIGASRTVVASCAGVLLLSMNDVAGYYADNDGSLKVSISEEP